MRLEDVEAITAEILYPEDIAGLLKANPETIRKQAKERPDMLGFPVIVMGRSVRIPKRAFIAFMRGEKNAVSGN